MSPKNNVTAKDVMKETALLVKALGAAAKEFRDSPEMKSAGRDALKAVQGTAKEFRAAIEKVRQGPANQALSQEVKGLFDEGKVKTEKALNQYRVKLAKNLKGLGRKVHDLADKVWKD